MINKRGRGHLGGFIFERECKQGEGQRERGGQGICSRLCVDSTELTVGLKLMKSRS